MDRISIIQQKNSMIQENLLAVIRRLANTQNTQLSEKETKQLLVSIQKKVTSDAEPQQSSKAVKNKKIRRFLNKNSFKKYIKNRMRNIIPRSLERVKDRPDQQRMMNENRNVQPKGGKSKFKKSTKRLKSAKQIRFQSKLRNGVKISKHEELTCPICLEILVSPALTACGHVFCLQCIDESLLHAQTCPSCRQNIKFSQPICYPVLDNLIHSAVHMSESQMQQYQARLAKFKSWQQSRFLDYNTLSIGTLIDVRDTESIWCQGTIVKIYHKKNETTGHSELVSLLIHYNRWNKLYDEIIEVPSSRLAPLECFSGRTDIPRYNLSEADNNLRGSVVPGQAVRIQFANNNPVPIFRLHRDFFDGRNRFDFDQLEERDEVIENNQSDSQNNISELLQGEHSNEEQQNQAQVQLNQDVNRDQAADEDARANQDNQFQQLIDDFRNRRALDNVNGDSPIQRLMQNRRMQMLQNVQMQDSPEEQSNSENQQEQASQQIRSSIMRNINLAFGNRPLMARRIGPTLINLFTERRNLSFPNRPLMVQRRGRTQLELMAQREAEREVQNNESERKQNEGSEQEAEHD